MKTLRFTILIQALISLLPLAYFVLIYKDLPEQVPMHYNFKNQVDRMGSRSEMWLVVVLMTVLSVGLSALLLNLDKIDPKKKYEVNSALMRKLSWTLVVFLNLLSFYMIYETLRFSQNQTLDFMGKGYLLLVTLILVVLGNFLNHVKPNYFVGIRTPWNLENEENWRKTHHLAAKLMFYGGLTLVLLILALPQQVASYVFLVGLVPIVLIPIVYSYLLFKREKQ